MTDHEDPPPLPPLKKLAHALFWIALCYGLWLLSARVMYWATGLEP